MTVASPQPKTEGKNQDNDWRLFLKLIPYTRQSRGTLVICLFLLIPLAVAGSIQPLIIGQAISLLKDEPTWSFLTEVSVAQGINLLSGDCYWQLF